MYVAITRARQRLYLSLSQSRMLHGQTRFNLKSRFLDELPEDALKWLTPRAGSGRPWGMQNAINTVATNSYFTGAKPLSDPQVVRKAPAHGLRLGQQVFHAKFGEGTVLTLEGSGDDARAQINFPRHGTKWLALSVAKLTPIA